MTKVISEKNENHTNWSWQKNKNVKYLKLDVSHKEAEMEKRRKKLHKDIAKVYGLKPKYELHISVSDLVRAGTSQKIIDELMEIYDDLESPKADITRVSFFTNGYINGIHISIECENKNDGRRYREEFDSVYENLICKLKRKPIKVISLINIKQLELIKKF